jgi:tRNA(fMet)-specific endonuclease VapC
MSKNQLLYLLDTNVCIVYLKGKSLTVNQRLKSLNRDDIAVNSLNIPDRSLN